jgi:hypothetical protein
MSAQVLDGGSKKFGVILEASESVVAGVAEKIANFASGVAVVNVKEMDLAGSLVNYRGRLAADGAKAILLGDHRAVVEMGNAKHAAEVPVLRSGSPDSLVPRSHLGREAFPALAGSVSLATRPGFRVPRKGVERKERLAAGASFPIPGRLNVGVRKNRNNAAATGGVRSAHRVTPL